MIKEASCKQKSDVLFLVKSELRGVCGRVGSIMTFAEFSKAPSEHQRRKKQQQAAKQPLNHKNGSVDFGAAW